MADQGVTSISRIELDLSGFTKAAQVGASKPSPEEGTSSTPVGKPETSPKPTDPKPAEKPAAQVVDISLRFRVDPNTNDVTIFILNRSSRQVVRTIPPEEMASLSPGEILQLFA